MSFIGLLRTLEQITRPPRRPNHDVDEPLAVSPDGYYGYAEPNLGADTEPGLTPDELVGVRGLLQERYGEACTCPSWGNPSWPHRHDCPANPSARVNQSPGACAEPTAPADLPAAGSGPSEVSGNPPPPSEGRPTSELLIKAAHVICDLRSGHPSAAATRQLVADLNARAAIFADIEQDK